MSLLKKLVEVLSVKNKISQAVCMAAYTGMLLPGFEHLSVGYGIFLKDPMIDVRKIPT